MVWNNLSIMKDKKTEYVHSRKVSDTCKSIVGKKIDEIKENILILVASNTKQCKW